MSTQQQYFAPKKHFELYQLEQLIYSKDRLATFQELFPHVSTQERYYYQTFFAQLDLEKSFSTTIHDKYQKFTEYLVAYDNYCNQQTHSYQQLSQDFRQLHLQHSLLNLQTILVNLGADDAELTALQLFHEQSCANIRDLAQRFMNDGDKFILQSTPRVLTTNTPETRYAFFEQLATIMRCYFTHTPPESTTSYNSKANTDPTSTNYNTFSHLLSRIVINELTTTLPTPQNPFATILKAYNNQFNPSDPKGAIAIKNCQEYQEKHFQLPSTTTNWLNDNFQPVAYPYILTLIELGVIDYKDVRFFPTLCQLLKSYHHTETIIPIGGNNNNTSKTITTTTTNNTILIDCIAYWLIESENKRQEIEKIRNKYQSDGSRVVTENLNKSISYRYQQWCGTFNDLELISTTFSFDALLTLQKKMLNIGDKNIIQKLLLSTINWTSLLIIKLIPTNFINLRNNINTTVDNAYMTLPNNEQQKLLLPTRNKFDTPIFIYEKDDLKKYSTILPSFLLTTMDIYNKIFDIMIDLLKSTAPISLSNVGTSLFGGLFGTTTPPTTSTTSPSSSSSSSSTTLTTDHDDQLKASRKEYYRYYYTMLTSFLAYTAQWNVWRFDLFNNDFLPAALYTRYSHAYNDSKKNYYDESLHFTPHIFNNTEYIQKQTLEKLFPINNNTGGGIGCSSFDNLIQLYIEQYYSQPQITTWKNKIFNIALSDNSLQELYYNVKAELKYSSKVIVDVICDQSNVLQKKDILLSPSNNNNNDNTIDNKLINYVNPIDDKQNNKNINSNAMIDDNNNNNNNSNGVTINVYNPHSIYKKEYDLIQSDLDDILQKQGQKNIPYITSRYNSSNNNNNKGNNGKITFVNNQETFKNKYCLDVNGNIRTTLNIVNVNNFIINVYYIDIMSWYKTQLLNNNNNNNNNSKNNADGYEIDPNVDLEGLIPHYTTNIDLLTNVYQKYSSTIKNKNNIIDLNLCFDNLPQNGVFVFEVLNGQEALRMLVKKGVLNCLQKQINKGALLLLFNQYGELLKYPRVFMGTNDVFKPLGEKLKNNKNNINNNNLMSDDDEEQKDEQEVLQEEIEAFTKECIETIPRFKKDNNINDNNNNNNNTTITQFDLDEKELSQYFIHIPSYQQTKVLLLTDNKQTFGSCTLLQPHQINFNLETDWFVSVEAFAPSGNANIINTSNNNTIEKSINTSTTSLSTSSATSTTQPYAIINNEYHIDLTTGPQTIIGGGMLGGECLIKPTILRNGESIDLTSVNIIKSSLNITAILQDGVTITDVVDNFELLNKNNTVEMQMIEILHAFNIPTNLHHIEFNLYLTIEFEGKNYDLSSKYSTSIGGIHKTSLSTGMIFLRRINGIYFAYVIDKTGRSIPYCGLRYTLKSTLYKDTLLYNTTLTNGQRILYTDINGCIELGPLYGIEYITLSTVDNLFNFVRGKGHFIINNKNPSTSQQSTIWPTQLNVIVNDIDIDKIPNINNTDKNNNNLITDIKYNDWYYTTDMAMNNNINNNIQPQITLPLPTTLLSNPLLFAITSNYMYDMINNKDNIKQFLKTSSCIELSTDSLKNNILQERELIMQLTTNNNSNNELFLKQKANVLNWFIKYGFLTLYEVNTNVNNNNNGNPNVRQITNNLLRCNETNIFIYGLKPSRNYILQFIFPTLNINYKTYIKTYRNPLQQIQQQQEQQDNNLIQLQYGHILPQHLYYNTTLNILFDYLICKDKVIQIKQSLNKQLLINNTTFQYNPNKKELKFNIINYNPTTTKVLLLATNLLHTSTDLKTMYLNQYNKSYNTIIKHNKNVTPQGSWNLYKSNGDISFVKDIAISGEREYILYRRELIQTMKQVGVMLPQPSLLLNKRLTRYTEPIEDKQKEKAKKGIVEKKEVEMNYDNDNDGISGLYSKKKSMLTSSVNHRHRDMRESAARPMSLHHHDQDSYGGDNYNGNSSQHFPSIDFTTEYNTYDILRYKSSLLCNITPQLDGSINIQNTNFDKYSNLTIIVYEAKPVSSTVACGINIMTLDLPPSNILDLSTKLRLSYNDKQHPFTVNNNDTTTTSSSSIINNGEQQPFVVNNSFALAFNPALQYAENHTTGLIPASTTTTPTPITNNNINITTTTPTSPTNQQQQPTTIIVGPNSTVELEVISSRGDLYSLLTSLYELSKSNNNGQLYPKRQQLPQTSKQSQSYIAKQEINTMLTKFRWMSTEWLCDFDDNQKLTYLDRYSCHEVHLFIFFNDRLFFEKYLRLHLANKYEKSIVDLWLLSQALISTSSTASSTTYLDDDTYDLLNNIKIESRQILSSYATKLSDLNILELILLLSIIDTTTLRQIALQMKNDKDKNLSINIDKNNLTWVNIIESLIRSKMLSLTLAQQDAIDGENNNNNNNNKENDDMIDSASSESDNDDIDNDDSSISLQNDMAPGFSFGAAAPAPPPPPVVCAAPMSLSRARPMMAMACAAPQAEMMSCSAVAPEPPRQMAMKKMAAPRGGGGFGAASVNSFNATLSVASAAAPMGGAILMSSKNMMSLDDIANNIEQEHGADLSSIPAYKPLDKTGEYEERTWYIDQRYDGDKNFILNTKDLITQWSNFWIDFALYLTNPLMFDIDNDESNPECTNKAFASQNIIDLIDANVTEYLLCLSLVVLSPQPQGKQLIQTTINGKLLSQSLLNNNTTTNNKDNGDNYYIFNQNNTQNNNNTLSLSNNNNNNKTNKDCGTNNIIKLKNNKNLSTLLSLQNKVNYKCIKHSNPKYPLIVLYKQTQCLTAQQQTQQQQQKSLISTTNPINNNNNNNKNLTASQYYIDIFESIQKQKQIYVQPTKMYQNRAYLCKTVISNMSSDAIKTKVLITLPDNTTSIQYNDTLTKSRGTNIQTINHTFTTKTIYITIEAYSSSIIQYSFLLNDATEYIHYGAVISSPNSCNPPPLQNKKNLKNNNVVLKNSSDLYCFVPSILLQTQKYQMAVDKKDVMTIAREASDDELITHLEQYYNVQLNNNNNTSTTSSNNNSINSNDIIPDRDSITLDDDDEQNNNNDLDDKSNTTQDDNNKQKFRLSYILFRFNDISNKNNSTLQQRFDLYTRIYQIVKGYIDITKQQQKSKAGKINNNLNNNLEDYKDCLEFVNYSIYFFKALFNNAKDKQQQQQQLNITPQQRQCLSHALSIIYKQLYEQVFGNILKPWQHLEYLPLVAARMHNSSIGSSTTDTNNNNNPFALTKKDPFIPDQQLLEQYTRTLQYCFVHSSNIYTIPYPQLLSLIYYAIILNQNVRVIALLKALFVSMQEQSKQTTLKQTTNGKTNNNNFGNINTTVRIQLAYVLIYLDIVQYGQLQTILTQQELLFLSQLFKNKDILNINNTKQTMYGIALLLSKQYLNYPIKQWKLLFLQSYQYLIDGCVIVDDEEEQKTTTTTTKEKLIKADDFDVNVAGQNVLQQALRQDYNSDVTPSLTCNVQNTLKTTNITVHYNNLDVQEKMLTFNLYYIDTELLLSHKPFMHDTQNNTTTVEGNTTGKASNNNNQFTKSHLSIHIPLVKNNNNQKQTGSFTIPLPAHITKEAALTIIAPKTHITTSAPLMHSQLIVHTLTQQGVVSVLNAATHKPVPGCYVKVYSAENNNFIKDTYTDIRGKAEYASTSNAKKSSNNNSTTNNNRIALIVTHPQYGCQVVYSEKPTQ